MALVTLGAPSLFTNLAAPAGVEASMYILVAARPSYVGAIISCTSLSTASNVEVSGTVAIPIFVRTKLAKARINCIHGFLPLTVVVFS